LGAARRSTIRVRDDQLLRSSEHHQRVGALSIMGKQFTRKATTEALRTELYELYLRAPTASTRGTWWTSAATTLLAGTSSTSRTVLYDLARSGDWWERRLASVPTLYFAARPPRPCTAKELSC
jgi:hypothetical protein